MCRSLHHDHSTGINDVIDELVPSLALKEAPPPEITVMVCVRTYLSAKSLGSERTQAAMFSWIVDVYIQIPWPHRVTRSNLDFGSSSSSARAYYCSLLYMRPVSGSSNSICGYLCNTAISRHIWCDVCGCGTHHVMKWTRPSERIISYCKRRMHECLGTRLYPISYDTYDYLTWPPFSPVT